jgi:PST family polysaccharide transporter
MAVVITGFVTIFVDMGIGQALIQKQDATDEHYCSVFWLNIALGLGTMLLVAGFSPLIAWFYHQPQLQPVVAILSFNIIFSSLTVVQQSQLMKEMEFRKLAIRDMAAVSLAGVVGIELAHAGFGVWSLVAQSLTLSAVNAGMVWVLSSWRPKFIFSLDRVKDMVSFSAHMTGFNAVNYLARNVDKLLIGWFLGSEAVGLYFLAYKFMMLGVENISWVISKVMFPAFSKIQKDLDSVRRIFVQMVRSVALLTFPLMGWLFVLAPEIVRIFLGPHWLATIILIKIFCVCGMAQSLMVLGGTIYMSQGRPDIQWKMSVMNLILAVVSISLSLPGGLVTVTGVYSIFHVIWFLVTLAVVSPLIKLDVRVLYRHVSFVFFLNAVWIVVIWGVKQRLTQGNDVFVVFMMGIIGAVLYGGMLMASRLIQWEKGNIILAFLK